MKTVGVILQEARTAKGLTLEDVERDTKIRARFLSAIENDDYTKLPSVAYAKGFVKNYSEYLGLNSNNVLAFFRRQTKEAPRSSLLPKASEPLNRTLFQLTPGKFLAILLAGLAILFVGYLGLQYKKLQEPPALVIDEPKDGLIANERRIDILGKTDSDATVTVNNISVVVRGDGKFFDQVTLEPGVNRIQITSTSRYGKTTTIKKEVAYQP